MSLGVVIVLAGWQRINARSPWLTLFSHETPQKQSQAAPTPSLQSSELEENSMYRSLFLLLAFTGCFPAPAVAGLAEPSPCPAGSCSELLVLCRSFIPLL